MNQTIYSFERSELRVLQEQCYGDNEKFLNVLADLIGNLNVEKERLKYELGMANARVQEMEL